LSLSLSLSQAQVNRRRKKEAVAKIILNERNKVFILFVFNLY